MLDALPSTTTSRHLSICLVGTVLTLVRAISRAKVVSNDEH
jgi:hypothetical protein